MDWFDEFHHVHSLLLEGKNDGDETENEKKKKRKYIHMQLNDIYRHIENKMIWHNKSYICWKLEEKQTNKDNDEEEEEGEGERELDDDNMNKTMQRWVNNFYEWKEIVKNQRKSTYAERERILQEKKKNMWFILSRLLMIWWHEKKSLHST